MRKLGVLLVVSILLFVIGCGTFVYELSQISPNQIDLSKERQCQIAVIYIQRRI